VTRRARWVTLRARWVGSGEDAHFIASGHGAGAMGVCDGVGGWASDGLSSADYARGILRECRARLPPGERAEEIGEGLRASLNHAHSQVPPPLLPTSLPQLSPTPLFTAPKSPSSPVAAPLNGVSRGGDGAGGR
jgi:hypothetical protein